MTERPDQPLPLVSPLAAALDAPLGGTAQPPPPATRTPARTFDELLWQAGNALNRAESVCYVLRSAIVAAGGKPFGQPAPVAADGAGRTPADDARIAAFLRQLDKGAALKPHECTWLMQRLAAAEAARAAAEEALKWYADKGNYNDGIPTGQQPIIWDNGARARAALAAPAGAKEGRA